MPFFVTTLARRLRRAAALPPETWQTAVRVVPTVLAARVALQVLPYRTTVRLFAPTTRPRRSPSSARVKGTLRVASWTGKTFLADRPCLSQALAARWLLARDGYATDLKLGARHSADGIMAHAWLEHDGHVVIGGSDSPSTYTAFKSVKRQSDDSVLPFSGVQPPELVAP